MAKKGAPIGGLFGGFSLGGLAAGKAAKKKFTARRNVLGADTSEVEDSAPRSVDVSGEQTAAALAAPIPEEEKAPVIIPLITKNNWRNKLPALEEPDDAEMKSADAGAPSLSDAELSKLSPEDRAAAEALLREATQTAQNSTTEDIDSIPLIAQNAVPGMDSFKGDDDKFRHDVGMRPDLDDRQYNRVKIDDYGKAILMGMGWTEGGKVGVGTRAKCVEPVLFTKRGWRQGLAAKEKPKQSNYKGTKKFIPKPGQENPDATRLRQRTIQVERLKPRAGSLVEVLRGSSKGKFARIRWVEGDEVSVKLNIGGAKLKLSLTEIQVQDEDSLPRDHPAFLVQSKSNKRKKSSKEDKKRDRKQKQKKRKRSLSPAPKRKKPRRRNKWVRARIRVRIISESICGGKYYNKKGIVTDVSTPFDFEVTLNDSGKTLSGVRESDVETIVPKTGVVMFLTGEHKGLTAQMMEKSSSKNQAVVQFQESLQISKCTLDEIAAFVD